MQAQYGLDLADAEVLERISWRKLQVLVAGLVSDSALMHVLRQRRRIGDVVVDSTVDNESEAREFWRRRAAKYLAGKGPH